MESESLPAPTGSVVVARCSVSTVKGRGGALLLDEPDGSGAGVCTQPVTPITTHDAVTTDSRERAIDGTP